MSLFATAEELNHKGCVLYNQGKYHEAIEQFSKSLQKRPVVPEVWMNFGAAFLALGLYVEAHDCYLKAEEYEFSEARPEIDSINWTGFAESHKGQIKKNTSGIGSMLGQVAAGNIGAIFGNYLEHAFLNSPKNNHATATINNVDLFLRQEGIEFSLNVTINNMLWRTCYTRIYFTFSDGTLLCAAQENPQYTCPDGQLTVQKDIIPDFQFCNWEKLNLFLPYLTIPKFHQQKDISYQLYVGSDLLSPTILAQTSETFSLNW